MDLHVESFSYVYLQSHPHLWMCYDGRRRCMVRPDQNCCSDGVLISALTERRSEREREREVPCQLSEFQLRQLHARC